MIYDRLRRKQVALTPEEGVRQAFVGWLIDTMGYPEAMMANEVSIELNSTRRRCDTVVYLREGLQPWMIVEYKAPTVNLSGAVFDQVARYNLVLGVPWLVVTNGRSTYCYHAPSKAFRSVLPAYGER